jgi:hypothetical protein
MKKILLTIIIIIGFMQADEWIYFNNMTDYEWGVGMDFSVSRISPDGEISETILEDVSYTDISNDGSRLLYLEYEQIEGGSWVGYELVGFSIYNTENMETISSITGIQPSTPRFTHDEDVVLYLEGSQYQTLYKYSFADSSSTMLSDSLSIGFDNMTMSPDGQQVVYFKVTEDENTEDDIVDVDVMVADIQSGESTLLTTIPYFALASNAGGMFNNNPYWSDDGFIYLSFLAGNCSQLFAIHSTMGYVMQLTDNPCSGIGAYCVPSILRTHETNLDKFIYTSCGDNYGHLIYDIESGESSYLGSFNPAGGVSIALDQTWSPDRSKVAFSEWLYGGMIAVPGNIRVYDTISESIHILGNDLNSDDPESYYAASPIKWLSDTLAGDVNGDSLLNVQDIVIIVNLILAGETNSSADYNGDGDVNILDIVALVSIILGN